MGRSKKRARARARTHGDRSVGKDSQLLAVLDHVLVQLLQRIVLELKPFLLQLRGRQQRYRLLKDIAGAAGSRVFMVSYGSVDHA